MSESKWLPGRPGNSSIEITVGLALHTAASQLPVWPRRFTLGSVSVDWILVESVGQNLFLLQGRLDRRTLETTVAPRGNGDGDGAWMVVWLLNPQLLQLVRPLMNWQAVSHFSIFHMLDLQLPMGSEFYMET